MYQNEGVLGQWPDGSKKFAKNFTKKHFSQNTYKYVYKLVLLAAASIKKGTQQTVFVTPISFLNAVCCIITTLAPTNYEKP